jgi:hypothetical protein
LSFVPEGAWQALPVVFFRQMTRKGKLRKVIDDEAEVRCASGPGVIREEVWEDEQGVVVRYNLAFINHFLTSEDNGRVLGYDASHGYHHRHFKGAVEPFPYQGYEALAAHFYSEFEILRKEKL